MSLPEVTVEAWYDGAWNPIPAAELDTSRDSITAVYGRPDSRSESNPTDVSLSVENPDLKWSPKDPNSALFEKIGLGTPKQLRIGDPQAAVELPGLSESYVFTPDAASLDVTGDIDVRLDLQPVTWRPSVTTVLIAKCEGEFSWVVTLSSGGFLTFSWTTDGTGGTQVSAVSTAAIPSATGRLAVRATLDVNNGAAGKTTTFYTAPTLGGTWTQLGSPVTTAGTTSIFASSVALAVGAGSLGGEIFSPAATLTGRVFGAQVRNGIAGAVVASPDFTVLEPGDTSFTDSAGLVWTVAGHATITDPSLRGSVTMNRFLPSWDRTTRDNRQALTGSGLLASLGVGEEPLRSSLFRDLSMNDSVVAYWPMEDGSGATSLASGIVGHPPMIIAGAVTLAGYNGFACSQPIPTFTSSSNGVPSYASGAIRQYVGAADQRVLALVHVPDAGVLTSNRQLLGLVTTGTAMTWTVNVVPGVGNLQVLAYNTSGTLVLDSGLLGFTVNGQNIMLSLLLSQNGADIDWQVSTFGVDGATGAIGGTLAGHTYGRFTTGIVGPSFDLAGTAAGHFAVINGDVDSVWDVMGRSLVAWAGETAPERIVRLCGEAGIPLQLIGDPAIGELMGPQSATGLMALIDKAVEAEMGWFGERQDYPGLLLRTRADLYNQDPALTLDMATGVISNPFAPPLDTQNVRNDITVAREGGSSYRAVQETGPNNIQSKRDDQQGIGVHLVDSKTLTLYSDEQLQDQATWRLFLGTVDEHRIQALEIEMHHHPELVQAVLELRGGDLIRILHPPPGLGPGPLDLLAMGWTDTITDQAWRVRINCAPGSPWQVVVLDDTDRSKLDTAGSEITTAITSSTTALKVATTAGPPWITTARDATQFPIPITMAGEDLSFTAISNNTMAFVGVGTAAHADNAAVSPGLPAGWAAGNLLLLLGSVRTGTPVRPTGYRLLHLNDGLALYGRIATSSESAPSFGISGGAAGSTVSAQMAAFSGTFYSTDYILADTAGLEQEGQPTGGVGVLNPSAQDIAYPAREVWIDNCVVLYLGSKLDDWTSVTSPGAEIGEPSSTLGNDQGIVWSYQIQTTATNIAAGSFVVTGGAGAVSRGSVVVIRCDVQNVTATRSANDVEKSHAAGTPLALKQRATLPL